MENMFEIGDVVQVKKERLRDDENQEDTVRVVVDYHPDKKYYLIVCRLNQADDRRTVSSVNYELVKKGDSITKAFAAEVRNTLPSEEEIDEIGNEFRNYIFALSDELQKESNNTKKKVEILLGNSSRFDSENYTIDLRRKSEGREDGDLICYCNPFFDIPLKLEIAIRKDGKIVFRKWEWVDKWYWRLHTDEISEEDRDEWCGYKKPFIPTDEQCDTVNGLFSGRITFEGLRLTPDSSLQKICPIDIKKEEKMIGKKIYLA